MFKIFSDKIKNASLLVRMITLSTISLSITVGTILLFTLKDEASGLKEHMDMTLDKEVGIVRVMAYRYIVSKDHASLTQLLAEYVKHPEIESIRYADQYGVTIEAINKNAVLQQYPDFFAECLSIRNISKRAEIIKNTQSYGTIEVTLTLTPATNDIWHRFTKVFFLLMVILLLNMLIIGLAMRRRLLPSLKAIEEGAVRLSNLDTDVQIKEAGAPELRKTLSAFNKMANTIRDDRETIKKTLMLQNTFFENNAAGFLLVSSNRTMLMANKQFYTMFGYTKEEILGKTVGMLHINEETYNSWAPRFQTVKDGMTISNAEYMLKHKDGRTMWCSLFGSKIELANDEKGVLWSLIDITERKSAEEELKRLNSQLEVKVENETAARLEQERILMQQGRMAAMGEMIGAIAHQWRQPLNSLGIMIQDLRYMQRDGELTQETLDVSVTKSMDIIKFMSKTIDDFRGFFKTDKQMTKAVIIEKVKHATGLLSAQLAAHGINISITGDSQLETICIPNELEQVVLNLVNNAKDVLVAGNQKEPEIDINVVKIDDKINIIISDNGGGIQEDILDKIFDPYFTTKGPDKGTGMGLYMSKIIVETHMNGKLSAKNSKNGAVFLIELLV